MARIEPGLVMDLHEHGVRLPPEQPNHTHASATAPPPPPPTTTTVSTLPALLL